MLMVKQGIQRDVIGEEKIAWFKEKGFLPVEAKTKVPKAAKQLKAPKAEETETVDDEQPEPPEESN